MEGFPSSLLRPMEESASGRSAGRGIELAAGRVWKQRALGAVL